MSDNQHQNPVLPNSWAPETIVRFLWSAKTCAKSPHVTTNQGVQAILLLFESKRGSMRYSPVWWLGVKQTKLITVLDVRTLTIGDYAQNPFHVLPICMLVPTLPLPIHSLLLNVKSLSRSPLSSLRELWHDILTIWEEQIGFPEHLFS